MKLLEKITNKQIIFILILISIFTVIPKNISWNDASRMATAQALVEDNTFSIDNTTFKNTGDKVYINNNISFR